MISEICRVSPSQDFETNHLINSLQRQIRACFLQEGRHLDKGGRFKAVVDLRPPSPSRAEAQIKALPHLTEPLAKQLEPTAPKSQGKTTGRSHTRDALELTLERQNLTQLPSNVAMCE